MRVRMGIRGVASLLAALLLISGGAFAQKAKKPARKAPTPPPQYRVDAGTVVRVRMNQTISSKSAVAGSTFNVTVTEPVYSNNGVVVIPTGSTLTARIRSVTKAERGGKPGQIDATFVSVRLPNGRTKAINGSLTELDAGKTSSDNEGGVSGNKMKHRKVVFIGGSAAGGALLGAIVGGGKATAIGAIVGAGAGLLGERLLKGPEAEVKSGAEFSVIFNTSVTLPKFVEAPVG